MTPEQILSKHIDKFYKKNPSATFGDIPTSVFIEAMNEYCNQLEAEKKELETTMCEILTAILKIPMCREVGYLQETIKAAARNNQ